MFDIVLITLVALAGGTLPLLVKWTDRHLHTALALSTGIFLGAVFLHLLPEVSDLGLQQATHGAQDGPHEHGTAPVGQAQQHEAGHESEHGESHASSGHFGQPHQGDMWLWLCVLAGVLGVYLIESLLLRTHDHDDAHRHKAVSYAALGGLSVHALTTGIAFAAVEERESLSRVFLIAILAHKGFEGFSLTTIFQLAAAQRSRILLIALGFSLVTPLGIVAGGLLAETMGERGLAILTALAAGTFLYVCLCELLTEVFHHREDSLRRVALLLLGIGLMVVFEGRIH